MKSIKSMTMVELVRTKVEIESAIYSFMQAEQTRQLLSAMRVRVGKAPGGSGSKRRPGKSLKGRQLPIRFRNPDNSQETWAGRGLKPRWLAAALKRRGSKLEDFAV